MVGSQFGSGSCLFVLRATGCIYCLSLTLFPTSKSRVSRKQSAFLSSFGKADSSFRPSLGSPEDALGMAASLGDFSRLRDILRFHLEQTLLVG